MIKDETIASRAPKTSPECGVTPALQVLKSAAGHCIGTLCRYGPYSQESLYYPLKDKAEEALRTDVWIRR
jgi:hypothetical protein